MPLSGKFDRRAQRVVDYAQQSAVSMKHIYFGTEHLLLGLLKEARDDVQSLPDNVTVSALRENVMQLYVADKEEPRSLQLTPKLHALLEHAVSYTQQNQMPNVTSALLWSMLLTERSSVAVRLLAVYDADIDALKDEVDEKLRRQRDQTEEGEEEKSILLKHGRDLTQLAAEGKLDPVIGRDKEIWRLMQILSRRTKNNPVLIGEPGVGKSAVAEGLAQRIHEGRVPESLRGKKLFSLDIGSLVAGTKYRGEFEERMKALLDEVRGRSDLLLFIDEIQSIVGAGKAEGSIDAAGILKPALARGELQCIGATTLNDYRKNIEKDPALSRRFQPVRVDEPTSEESIQILKGLRAKYEEHHHVIISDEALEAAVTLSGRYIADRFLPDKAVDLMDEAASAKRMHEEKEPSSLKEIRSELEALTEKKRVAIEEQAYEQAASLRDREQELRKALHDAGLLWRKQQEQNKATVDAEDIAKVVAGWTGIPVQQMTTAESERLIHLEEELHRRVIGQDEAVSAVSRAIRRARAGLKDPRRPMGSFIFLGPTGVGKTELCRALGQALFGDEDAVIRLDMSEYMEKHTVSRMVGSPPGYVGFEEGGQLTEAVRRKPYSVVLFDEVEKAHPDVFNMLLQILEDGRLTDNTGRVTNFQNTIIVLTSNVGAQAIAESRSLGFGRDANSAIAYSDMKDKVLEEVRHAFKPEFINRLDELIVFHPLADAELQRIAALMVSDVAKRLKEQGIVIEYDDEVVTFLAKAGYDPKYGARPLRRAIQRNLEDALSDAVLSGKAATGKLKVAVRDESIRIVEEKETQTV